MCLLKNIALSSNDEKSLQNFDGTASCPYGTGARKLCKTELLEYIKIK